jgi:hypothetical protein
MVERRSPRTWAMLAIFGAIVTATVLLIGVIARTLTISKGTAKVHVERIIRKLGVSDRTQAAVRAIELGFTSLETRRQPYS